MHRSFIRSDSIKYATIPELQVAYEEVQDSIELARVERDRLELTRLLVDLELLGEMLDQRYEQLLKEIE